MKKLLFVMMLCLASMAWAQNTYNLDATLGPHNGPDSAPAGCSFCHAPHNGAQFNGGTYDGTADASTGKTYLWGRALPAGGFKTFDEDAVTLPLSSVTAAGDTGAHSYLCMSCHDGTTVPISGMAAKAKVGLDDLTNDHPTHVGYGTSGYNWALTGGTSGTSWKFVNNLQNPASKIRFYNNSTSGTNAAYVECSSCHNPHNQGTGGFAVAHFLRDTYTLANNANFCRTCHFSKSSYYAGYYNNGVAK